MYLQTKLYQNTVLLHLKTNTTINKNTSNVSSDQTLEKNSNASSPLFFSTASNYRYKDNSETFKETDNDIFFYPTIKNYH